MQAAAVRAARVGAPLAREAAAVVRRMALDASALRDLGADPSPDMEPLIGSSEGWVERRGPSCGPLGVHDGAFSGELAFRTVRSGRMRALFGQVVAFDTALAPHVTPFVAVVELRTDVGPGAPACVLERTGAALEAVPFEQLPESAFIQQTGEGRVGCARCHTGTGPYDLADLGREQGGGFRIERRIAQLERARERGEEIGALLR
jgi:hypothetical protein